MEKFRLQPGEQLLVNDPHATWIPGGLNTIPGQLKLTNKRLVFIRHANPFALLFGLFMKSLRAQVLFDWKLGDIKDVTRKEFAGTKRLVIDPGFERPKEFGTMKIGTFEPELKRLIEKKA